MDTPYLQMNISNKIHKIKSLNQLIHENKPKWIKYWSP